MGFFCTGSNQEVEGADKIINEFVGFNEKSTLRLQGIGLDNDQIGEKLLWCSMLLIIRMINHDSYRADSNTVLFSSDSTRPEV